MGKVKGEIFRAQKVQKIWKFCSSGLRGSKTRKPGEWPKSGFWGGGKRVVCACGLSLQWPQGSPRYRAEWVGFVLSLTYPVTCPATDFPADAIGQGTEGEKIGQCRFIPTPEKWYEARVLLASFSYMKGSTFRILEGGEVWLSVEEDARPGRKHVRERFGNWGELIGSCCKDHGARDSLVKHKGLLNFQRQWEV